MTETKEPGAETIEIRLLHAGRCRLQGGKMGQVFYEVHNDGEGGEDYLAPVQRAYGNHKNVPRGAPGVVYRVQAAADGSGVWWSTAKFAGRWGNAADCLRWDAETRAFDLRQAADSAAKKETSRNLLREQLAPLRRVWLNSVPSQRTALEVLVLHYLKTGDAGGD